jgi:hypothetical protein
MPDIRDKHGRPKLWATITCLVPGCGGQGLIWPDKAMVLARKIEDGLSVRYLVGKLKCRKCGYYNASLAFHLAYPGNQPWDKRKTENRGFARSQ